MMEHKKKRRWDVSIKIHMTMLLIFMFFYQQPGA